MRASKSSTRCEFKRFEPGTVGTAPGIPWSGQNVLEIDVY